MKGLHLDRRRRTLTLLWSGDPYEIDFERIRDPMHVCGWVAHLCGKHWMTKERIEAFLEACADINEWGHEWMMG